MRFSDVLKDLMIDKNVNVKDLADAIEMNKSSIYFYFQHDSIPDVNSAIKLSRYFNCSIDYLLGLSDDKNVSEMVQERSFIENYEFLLQENKTSNYNVCKNLHINRNSIYNWRNGQIPKMVILIELAKHFQVSVDYLLGEKARIR